MIGYRLSSPADADVEDIWVYIAQDNEAAADRFIDTIAERFSMLASHPHAGRTCDELRPGLYRIPVGNFIIFYRIESPYVEIARVLHGARDIEALFQPRELP